MKVTEEMIEKVKRIAEDPYREYEYIGIRVQEQSFKLGDLDHVSHIWEDGIDTGEELSGVCVLSAQYAHLAIDYFGKHAAIIGGNSAEYGEDIGELIVSDPIVLEVLA